MSGQHCESYNVKRETVHCYPVNSSLLTAVARDGWNLSAVFNLNVSRDEVEGNIEILGKQNSLFPSGPVIKCLLLFIQNIFRFWLVKATHIIHHNQLLFTKFGKNLRHIESMTSKVEPTENYWTNDVKMTSKVQPAAGYWTVDRGNLGTRSCYFWWAENKERNDETPLRTGKYFE